MNRKQIHKCGWMLVAGAIQVMSFNPLYAQDTGAPDPDARRVQVEQMWKKQVEFFGFEQVPLTEVLGLLREEFPAIQFVTNGPAEKLQVSLELRWVGLEEIVRALEIHLDGRLRIQREKDNLMAVLVKESDASKPILRAYSVEAFVERQYQEMLKYQSEKDATNERDKLAMLQHKSMAQSEAILLDAVHSSIEMLKHARGNSSGLDFPQLNMHAASRILIVVGQPEAVDVVGQIIQAFNGGSAGYGYGGLPGGDMYGGGLGSGGGGMSGGAGGGFGSGR